MPMWKKNNSIIRTFVGYDRYNSQGEVGLLNQLYSSLHLLMNWFLPSQKLLHKERNGSHVTKVEDQARPPVYRYWHGKMYRNRRSNSCDQHAQRWT
jgi:hypothetical protein